MKLQELISPELTKAFFLGVLSAEKPLHFSKAAEELLSETPDAFKEVEAELKAIWDELVKNKPAELEKLLLGSSDLKEYLTHVKDQLDFYLTALSLSGTNTENCSNEEMADLIDELEDTVMDLDEYLSEEKPDVEEGEELKEMLMETWLEYLKVALN
jgi:hypothetical protein